MLSASRSTFGVVGYTRRDPALSFYRRLAPARLWPRFPLTKTLFPPNRTNRNELVGLGCCWLDDQAFDLGRAEAAEAGR